MKATSNQKARPCMYPVVQVLNWRGISILSEWKGQPYVISNLDMDMDYLCSSFSWAEAKSVVWPMGRDMRIRMSNVSTMGCLKYSAIASGCKTETSTPWNDLCCLHRERERERGREGERERERKRVLGIHVSNTTVGTK